MGKVCPPRTYACVSYLLEFWVSSQTEHISDFELGVGFETKPDDSPKRVE